MASDRSTVQFVVDQMGTGATFKAMFGEYGIYLDRLIIGLFCDNRLFLKPTPQATALLGESELGPAYPGAKPSIIVPENLWDEGAFMKRLARATALGLEKAGAAKKPSAKNASKKAPSKAESKAAAKKPRA